MAFNDPDGLVNLRKLADEIKQTTGSNKSNPIVLVPGFSGWGAPLFGAVNYFGGIIDIPRLLADEGYTVIVAPVAPISTNWERACELYRQLKCGGFSKVDPQTGFLDERHDLDVDYGSYFQRNPGLAPELSSTSDRRRAILFSNSTAFDDWKWDKDHKVHFICHSQGGNTVRYLISLMANGAGNLHPTYFNETGRDNWTISVTTIGTPHRGTTIIDVLKKLFSEDSRQDLVGMAGRLFATASFRNPMERTYDLQLDHWGIRRNGSETFQDMLARMESEDGPVWRWLSSQNTGFHDNSIEGVHDLSGKAITTSQKVYYFSLSFHATNDFPTAWPRWGQDAMESFPTNIEDFVRGTIGRIPLAGWLVDRIIDMFTVGGWAIITAITPFRSFVDWITKAVITRLLREMDYNLVLPDPAVYIPRKDVIPILLPFVYGIGSQELSQEQNTILGSSSTEDWFQNDGVVNTASMRGPKDSTIKGISELMDLDFKMAEKRGVYWHLGANDQMDHADQIGVFIERSTGDRMKEMYLNIANVISRMPTDIPPVTGRDEPTPETTPAGHV